MEPIRHKRYKIMNNTLTKTNDVSVVISGEAGQGIDTISNLLLHTLKESGLNVFVAKEYMSRVRGGINSTQIRISTEDVSAFIDRIDILVVLDKKAFKHLQHRISKDTIILADEAKIDLEFGNIGRIIKIPMLETVKELGSLIYINTISAGIISGLLKTDINVAKTSLISSFEQKGENVVNLNISAVEKGYSIASKIIETEDININLALDNTVKNKIIMTGTEAVATGCLSGGCNFISSYPMSPGTGVLTFLANASKKLDILVEQVEDEISAINMAIGAWYVGARAMVTTSGGGFALMVEGVSLAGMIESPIVIHIAQRPGPATGLPTRTEQGDLELALYSGHGEFPRAIFAPGNAEEAFEVSQKAFNIADKYQVPTFILTDQYLLDSHYMVSPDILENINVENYIVEAEAGYKRYKLGETGVSPRAIPGFGVGFVTADSDEHDEFGNITEDLDIRVKMQDKRLSKLKLLQEDALAPILSQNEYKTIIIGWGSTLETIKEAITLSGKEDVAHLHYKQVYPVHSSTIDFLKKAEKIVIVENNATSQFGKLIKLATGMEADMKILKYNGLPFSVEELAERIKGL